MENISIPGKSSNYAHVRAVCTRLSLFFPSHQEPGYVASVLARTYKLLVLGISIIYVIYIHVCVHVGTVVLLW